MPAFSIELAFLVGRAVFLVFCFVLAAVTFTRWRRSTQRSSAAFAEQSTAVLEKLAGLEARLEATQAICGQMAERLTELGSAAGGNANTPSYPIAIRMARGGSSREELMSNCGITRQEADLVLRLHAPQPQPRMAAVG